MGSLGESLVADPRDRSTRQIPLGMQVFAIILGVLLTGLALPNSAEAGCAKDTDCKGDRICENEKCVDDAGPKEAALIDPAAALARARTELQSLLRNTSCGEGAVVKEYGFTCDPPRLATWEVDRHEFPLVRDTTHWKEIQHLQVPEGTVGVLVRLVGKSQLRAIRAHSNRDASRIMDVLRIIGGNEAGKPLWAGDWVPPLSDVAP